MSDNPTQPPTPDSGYIVLRSEDVPKLASEIHRIEGLWPTGQDNPKHWRLDRIEAAIRAAAVRETCRFPECRCPHPEEVHCDVPDDDGKTFTHTACEVCRGRDLVDALASAREADAPSPDEYGWMIEFRDPAPTWWDGVRFTPDPNHGVRFARRDDAERAVLAVGDEWRDDCIATEHIWTEGASSSPLVRHAMERFRRRMRERQSHERGECAKDETCWFCSGCPSPERPAEPHPMRLVDTCYGITGGDPYVCERSGNRIVVRPNAASPTCACKRSKGETER